MKKMLTIKRNLNIQVRSTLTPFLSPPNIYIPIQDDFRITKKEIKKDQLISVYHDFPYYSGISGEICAIKTIDNLKYLVIANDYKEENIKGITHDKSLGNLMKNYVKNFNWNIKDIPNTIYLNGICDNVYDATASFYHKNNTIEILNILDLLREQLHIKEVKILLKENDTESIEAFKKYLGTYLFIYLELVPDVYPIGNPKILKEYLNINEAIFLTTFDAITLYSSLIEHIPLREMYVTISGDNIDIPRVFKVKIGTKLTDLLNEFYEKSNIKEGYINNLLNRNLKKIEDIIITPEITAILFFKEKIKVPQKCINCGKCLELCPMGCNPLENNYQGCINCGICSYICPSNIDFNYKNRWEC